jgi:hypothetical protein
MSEGILRPTEDAITAPPQSLAVVVAALGERRITNRNLISLNRSLDRAQAALDAIC